MRKFALVIISVLTALILTGCPGTVQDPVPDPVTYAIGDTGPAGGLIFYIDEADAFSWDYLEAASADQTNRAWGTTSTDVTGADGIAIGTGKQNTQDIIDPVSGDPLTDKAADECSNYSVTNNSVIYTDWFLPSIDELDQMYSNLYNQIPSIGGFADSTYLSSSEASSDSARTLYFTVGNQSTAPKTTPFKVRPFRAF